ncbi:hypothetical protein E8K88_11925 [Lampropedia aestuarii]|uniref:Scaffolding protein n=1 Tax=Lampropedia aestuarii TaxID=2562762 RepID=A0A4S5BNF5_9BURK|nr:hypothetical protein [Lampropedia aestuarii]THJ32401.1 hypothetical protein E8K88_11925 [Lampropedia aestuarii]
MTNQVNAYEPTDEEVALSLLSPEEREALGYELEPEQGGQSAKGGDDEDDDNDRDDDEEGDTAGEKTPGDDGAPDAGAAAASAPDEAAMPEVNDPAAASATPVVQAPVAAPEPAGIYQYKLPDDYGDRVKALQDKFEALDQRVEDGDLTSSEYAKEVRALTREQSELDSIQARHDIAKDMAEQAQQQAAQREVGLWEAAVAKLVDEVEADATLKDKPDYRNDQRVGAALSQQVQAIMAARGIDGTQPIADKEGLLRDAHRALHFLRTGTMIGTSPAPAVAVASDAVNAKAAKEKAVKQRKADLSSAVPSLGALPGADSGTDGGEFASLASLDGDKLEDALGKLARSNPAAYKRYMTEA